MTDCIKPRRKAILNILIVWAVVLLTATLPFGCADKGKHLFILSGQSNMVGLDPAISFTPAVAEAFGAEHIIVVKDAQSGQPIRRWYKSWHPASGDEPGATGDLYDRLMAKVDSVVADEKIETVTFIWMQGERDAREGHGEVYAESLMGLAIQLSADLDRDDINVVIGRLSDFDLANEKYPHWTLVRDAQVAVAEAQPRWAWVNTDDLNDKVDEQSRAAFDDLHYSAAGYKILGERLAEKAIELVNK